MLSLPGIGNISSIWRFPSKSRKSKDGGSNAKRPRGQTYDAVNEYKGGNLQKEASLRKDDGEGQHPSAPPPRGGPGDDEHSSTSMSTGNSDSRQPLREANSARPQQTPLDPAQLQQRQEEEKNFIRQHDSSEAHVWYLIDVQWLQAWKHFVTRGHQMPGPIDNSRLIDRGTGQPKRGLAAVDDYRGVNQEIWHFWLSRYGGGPTIRRALLDLYAPEVDVQEPVSHQGGSLHKELPLPGAAPSAAAASRAASSASSAAPAPAGTAAASQHRRASGSATSGGGGGEAGRERDEQSSDHSSGGRSGTASASTPTPPPLGGGGTPSASRVPEKASRSSFGMPGAMFSSLGGRGSSSSSGGAAAASSTRGSSGKAEGHPSSSSSSGATASAQAGGRSGGSSGGCGGVDPRRLTGPSGRAVASSGREAAGAEAKLVCDKCDGPHETDRCPHFKKAREKHQDAWTSYGKVKKGQDPEGDGAPIVRHATVVPQPGDGSCLFHSLCYGLREGSSASSLRRDICGYIAKNPDMKIADTAIEEWIRYDSNDTVSQYAKRMAGGNWGGGIEMAAVTKMKGVNVHVYEKCREGYRRISAFECPGARKTVSVLYQGRMHYDAIVV